MNPIRKIPVLIVMLALLAACAPATAILPTQALSKSTDLPTALPTPLLLPVTPVSTATTQPAFTIPPATPKPTVAPTSDTKGAKVPVRALALQFLDPQNGYLVGDTNLQAPPSTFGLGKSSDGGRTWLSLPLPAVDLTIEYPLQGGFFFLNMQEGWFFYKGLHSTRNGGLAWIDEKPNGQIIAMSKAPDGTVYALEQSAGGWKSWLVKGSYSSWQPLLARLPDGIIGLELVVANPQTAWVLGAVEMKASTIHATQDGGKTWSQLKSPCADYPSAVGGWLVAVDARNLWLGCGVPAGAGSGSKFVFTSADGGKTWALKGKGALPPQADNTFTVIGYFAGIQALSPSFAYMSWQRTTTVRITRDGGQKWEVSPLPCSTEFMQVQFVDTLNGWAYDQTCVNRTNDGGKSWACSLLPDGKPCP